MSEEDIPELEEPEDEPRLNLNLLINIDDEKYAGIPCPDKNTLPQVEAKPILLRCIICRENQIQTVNFPCMHACFCTNCASESLKYSNNCPQCRTEYMHISMLYLCYGDPEKDPDPDQNKKRKVD